MNQKITIAIDVMGGEGSPKKTIEGLSIFCKSNSNKIDYFFNLYGKQTFIENEIQKYKINKDCFKIYDTNSLLITLILKESIKTKY